MNFNIKSQRMHTLVYIAFIALINIGMLKIYGHSDLSQNRKIWLVLLELFFFVFLGLTITRKFRFSACGLTVIWFEVFMHTYTWDSLPYCGVYLLSNSRSGDVPFIVFSKRKWPSVFKRNAWAALYPFRIFLFEYSPKLFEEIKKVCPRLEYMSDRKDVVKSYIQREKQ